MLGENLKRTRKEEDELRSGLGELEAERARLIANEKGAEEEIEALKYARTECKIAELEQLSSMAKESAGDSGEKYALAFGQQIAIYRAELKEVRNRLGIGRKQSAEDRLAALKQKATELEKLIEASVGREDYERADQLQTELAQLQEEIAAKLDNNKSVAM